MAIASGVFALFIAVRSCIYALAPDPGPIVNDSRMTLRASGALDGAVRLRMGNDQVNCVTAAGFMDTDIAKTRLLPGQALLSVSMPAIVGARPVKIEIVGALNRNLNTYAVVPDAAVEKHPEQGLRVRFVARPDPPPILGGDGSESRDDWLAKSGTVTILRDINPGNAALHGGQVWGSMHVKLVPQNENPDQRPLTLDGGWLCNHTKVPVEFERPSPSPTAWLRASRKAT